MVDSYALANIANDSTAASSEDAAILKLEQQAGLRDSNGADISDNADALDQQKQESIAGQLGPVIERATKPKEPKNDPITGKPMTDTNNTLVQAEAGVFDAVQGMVNAGIEVSRYASEQLGYPGLIHPDTRATFAEEWFPESDLVGNKLMRGATQFLVPFKWLSTAGKAAKVVAAGEMSTKASALVGAATTFLAFDKDATGLSHLAQDIPTLAHPIAEMMAMPAREAGKLLAGNPEDNQFVRRIKNTLEGLGMGVATHYVFKGLQSLFAKKVVSEQMQALSAKETQAGVSDAGPQIVPPESPTPPSGKLSDTAIPADISLDKEGPGQTNLTKIDAPIDTKMQMAQIDQANNKQFLDMIGPKLSNEEVKFVGENAQFTPKSLLEGAQKGKLTDPEVHAARIYYTGFTKLFIEHAQKAMESGLETDAAMAMKIYENAQSMGLVANKEAYVAGRTLNSFNIPVEGEQAAKIAHMQLELQNPEDVRNFLAHAAKSTPEEVQQVGRAHVSRRLGAASTETFVGNLLLSPTAHVKNFVSNFMNAAYTNLETAIASRLPGARNVNAENLQKTFAKRAELMSMDTGELDAMGMVKHKEMLKRANAQIMRAHNAAVIPGEAMTTAEFSANEAAGRIMNQVSALLDAMHVLPKLSEKINGTSLVKAVQRGESVPPGVNQWEMKPAITAENLGYSSPANKFQKIANDGIDIWGGLQRVGMSGLDNADNFQKWVNYRGSIHAKALKLAQMQELRGAQKDAFISEFLSHPPENMTMESWNEAAYKTWTNPLQTEFAQRVDSLMKFNVMGVQPLRFFWPFTKTPGNIAQFALDRSPLAFYSQNYTEAMLAGGAKKQMALARLGLGNAVIGAATLFAATGHITGSGPSSPRMRKLMEDAGWKPNAIKIGDTYHPIKSFAPVGDLASMGADGAELLKVGYHTLSGILHMAGHMGEIGHAIGSEVSPEDAGNLAGLFSWVLVNHSTPEMFVDTLSRVTEAIQEKDVGKLVPSEIASTIPLTGYTSIARRAMDPSRRNTDFNPDIDWSPLIQETMNQVKNKIPGLSETLPARQNLWGKDVQYPAAFGPDFVSPFIGTKYNDKDSVMSELVRLGYIGQATNVKASPGEAYLDIGMPPKTITQGPIFSPTRAFAKLNPEEYHRYVQLSAGEGLKGAPINGKNLKEALTETVASDDYKQGTDQYKRLIIKKYISGYRKAAKAQLLDEMPQVQQKLIQNMEDKVSALGGGE